MEIKVLNWEKANFNITALRYGEKLCLDAIQ